MFDSFDFNSATKFNLALKKYEEKCFSLLFSKHSEYIKTWDYGYFFLTALIEKYSTIDLKLASIAALFTEYHSNLRCAFLLNLYGYQTDSITCLRKVHESIIRCLTIVAKPDIAGKIIMSSGLQNSHKYINASFLDKIFELESSFAHSNKLKALEPHKAKHEGYKYEGPTYGPRMDDKYFLLSANLSIFWLYVGIKSVKKIFPEQVDKKWLTKSDDIALEMKRYLEKCRSPYHDDCKRINEVVEKLPIIAKKKQH